MKKKKFGKFFSLLATFALLFNSYVAPVLVSDVRADQPETVDICHSTGSHSNPYIVNSPSKSGDLSGHDADDGPIWFPGITEVWGDIIPPFDYGDGQLYPGKNWTAEGQAIWNNDCNIPDPEPEIPYYNGQNSCPEGTVRGDQAVTTHVISSQNPVGVTFPLAPGGYLFEASETFIPTGAPGYLSDAGYTLVNGEVSPLYGINAPAPGYGAHALLGDLGNGVGIVDWGEYNPDHVYTKYYEPTIENIQFVIGDRYGTWFNTDWDNQVDMEDNDGSLNLNVYECIPETGTIIVYKVTNPEDDGQTPFGVTLFNAAGAVGVEKPLTTGSSAEFVVNPGTYWANETSKPGGWDGNDSDCQEVVVGAGETEECTIYNTKHGTIQGTKYYDSNANGIHDYTNDPFEHQLLNGWTIRLYDKDWQLKATTVTSTLGNEGQYRFHASPGEYFICEVVQDGWTQSGPLSGASTVDNDHNSIPNGLAVNNQSNAGDEGSICWEINLEPGEKDDWLKFGNYQLGSIFGYKWEDGDGNPATHGDKEPVPNWVMELWEKISGNFQDTGQRVMTDASGYYSFIELLTGIYGIKEQMKPGWVPLSPIDLKRGPIEVGTSGDPVGPINFVNFDLGYISGHKWNDLNGDGDWDKPEEPAIEGWKIYAEYPGGVEHSSTTDSNGLYNFPDLANGIYRVYEKIGENPGWVQTAPAGNEYVINMTSNAVELDNPNYDFGNKQNPVKIKAYKVVCDSEDLLPNWGNHGSTIDANTAQNYENSHPGCHLEERWQFQWAGFGAGDSGSFQTDTSLLGGSWNTFVSGDTVEIFDISNLGGRIETREVFPSNDYVPFSNAGDVSAEFYCTGDVYNYDNWEWINNPQYGQTYYCVGFNALKTGTITVEKDVVPDDESSWNFKVSGPNNYGANSNASEGQNLPLKNLLAGSYVITETQQEGYELIDISCDAEYGREGNSVEVYVGPGEEVTCTFTNEKDILDVSIDKSNNKSGGASVGDTVTYTLVVTNNGNRVLLDPQIIDVLPGGFEYVAGSTIVEGLPFSDPTETNGKLVWDLTSWGIKPQTSLTLVYQATIGDDVTEGTHPNLATCKAMYRWIDGDGEGLWIECNIASSIVPIGATWSLSASVGGEVLGIATELPPTGSDTRILIWLLTMLFTGVGFKLTSNYLRREKNV